MFESLASCFAFRCSAPLNMTEELASGGALRAVRRPFSMGDNSLLKLENNFTVALALRGMCDRRFDFA